MRKLDRFVIVCAGMLVERGKVLMIKETKKVAAGLYNLPAGTLEPGESIKQALVREVHEETGLRVKPVRLIGVYERVRAKLGNYVVLFVFSVVRTGGQVRTSREHPEVKFITIPEVRRLKRAGLLRFTAVTEALAELKKKKRTAVPIKPI